MPIPVIAVDDPRHVDVRDLIERHVAFSHGHSPPEDAYALDTVGLLDATVTVFSARMDGELLAIGAIRELDESSTNRDYMNLLSPTVAVINTRPGQGGSWHHPRISVVEDVLMAQATCITVAPALVLQTEEGSPDGSNRSEEGFCVGDVVVSTTGVVDRVAYTGSAPWPDPTGAPMQLQNASADNADGANWDVATARGGNFGTSSPDLGTPGG